MGEVMIAQEITKALGGHWHGSYGTARCPAHDDRERVILIAGTSLPRTAGPFRQPRSHARFNRMIERI